MKLPIHVLFGVSLWVLTTVPQPCASEAVVVSTPQGLVKGVRSPSDEGDSYMDTFFGIPFGQPPVGELRFKPPLPASNWTGTYEAVEFSPMCPQSADGYFLVLPVQEDCLYLDIYAPKPPSDGRPMPVMVWIFGGAFKHGCNSYYRGNQLAKKGVVVVTLNYRLDVFGFLSTLDEASPGNYGLLDQILALKWVKNSISSFNGDPNDVTVFGESAGSASISLLRLSPLANGLFNKAIMESGVSLMPWAINYPPFIAPDPRVVAEDLAAKVNCSQSADRSTADLVQCLRSVPVNTLLEATKVQSVTINNQVLYRPTVETVYGVIPDSPPVLLSNGVGSNITAIMGVNKDEFSLFSLPLADYTMERVRADTERIVSEYFPHHDTQTLTARIIDRYFKNLTTHATHEQLRTCYLQLMTDFNFITPAILEARKTMHIDGHAPLYLYEFTHRSAGNWRPSWEGVKHSADLPYVFGLPFSAVSFLHFAFPYSWRDQDREVSGNIMSMWTNFAKSGNPTPQAVGGVTWSPYSLGSHSYLDIGSSFVMRQNLNQQSMQFWLSIIQNE